MAWQADSTARRRTEGKWLASAADGDSKAAGDAARAARTRLLDGPDGDGRGGAPAGVAAHPVGDDEERRLQVDEEGVLVVLAAPPDVGDAPGFDGKWRWGGHERRGW